LTHKKIFLDYTGPVDQKVVDHLLQNLKKTKEYMSLSKTPGKRVYSILVECLENIAKHTPKDIAVNHGKLPYISAGEWDDSISIYAGNPILREKTDLLVNRLDKVNNMSQEDLTILYEKILNRETKLTDNGAGAGLGFILMKLKSGKKIDYSFTRIDDKLSFFEIQISINKHTMRKLIIDKTINSPQVIFDPEINRFEISGESRPSDVASFYLDILKWFDDYSSYLNKTQELKEPIVFNFDFEYFNSSSAKYILDFCKQIGDVRSKGKNLEVKWHYDKDDLDMLQVGREMSRISRTPFEYIEKDI
jgi:SiaC family regulatory phosphoprotein/Family of unknown function (DUF6272)